MTNDDNDVVEWAVKYLSSHGYTLKCSQPEAVQKKTWSYVIRFVTTNGYIYLKQTPRLIALEPIITSILHDQFHASVPEVIAHNSELNCFLMKDAGSPLRKMLKMQFDVELLCKGIDQFTSLQLKVANHIDLLIEAGVPDWRLNKLPDLFAKFLSQKDILIADGLSEKEIGELEDLLPKVANLCKKLADYSIKQSIAQPDFSDNNLLVDDMLNITLVDLGEIVISHPFFSLINCLKQVKKHYALIDKDDTYLMIMRACLKNYMNDESKEHLQDAFMVAEILWFVYWALANYRLMVACGEEKLMVFQPGRIAGELKNLIVVCHRLVY